MNIAHKLAEGHSKQITTEIVKYIGNNPARFKELVNYFLGNDVLISQRASWALGDAVCGQPDMANPFHRILIDCLKNPENHNSIRRNIVRIYQAANIPNDYEAELYDVCLNFIADTDEAIAVRAFSIRVCERVIEKYPEMANELVEIIKANISIWSSGLKSRGSKFLKKWG